MINTRELDKLIKAIKEAEKDGRVHRKALIEVHGLTAERIFKNGKLAKDGRTNIGMYSSAYKKIRRKKNYPRSNKVILQATGQMVNDYVFIVKGKEYGSGFNQKINFDKSNWMEDKYGTIWDLTKKEIKSMQESYGRALEYFSKI